MERIHVGRLGRAGAAGGQRPLGSRPQARRRVFGGGRGRQGVAVRRLGHHLRGRRYQRRLSHRFRRPGGIPHQRQRHALLLRRRRRAARQSARGARQHPHARQDHPLRHGRPAPARRPHVLVVRGASHPRARLRRSQSQGLGCGDRQGPGGRSDDPHLYLRHHRPTQGLDDRPRQHDVHDDDAATQLRRPSKPTSNWASCRWRMLPGACSTPSWSSKRRRW